MHTATAHDALTELTQTFTNAEIAEVLGVAPETVSRLKNEDRDPRGEVAHRLDAFHYVFHRALSRMDGDRRVVRWAFVRRQEVLDGGTVAGLLRALQVDQALAVLDALSPAEKETAEDVAVSEAFDEALLAAEQLPAAVAAGAADTTDTDQFLSEHPDVRDALPPLIAGVRRYLGEAEVLLTVASDEFDGEELVVQFRTPLRVDEAAERMRRFYAEHWAELVGPYSDRVSIAVE